ncbi:hypothetical protein C4K19_5802 [Pseudomonas chlororaphis subsp. aurantiaca]|nr:hypothetical protein C4K19_5802 [Pseudomonas chlororaphis subsp. aurantiaca]
MTPAQWGRHIRQQILFPLMFIGTCSRCRRLRSTRRGAAI